MTRLLLPLVFILAVGSFLPSCRSRPPASAVKANAVAQPEVNGAWTPLVSLRDKTDTFPGSHTLVPDDGGWWVSPIHVNLLANGKVVVTGWSRPIEKSCADHQGRRNGTSFLLDPAQLDVSAPTTLAVTPIDEQPRFIADKRDPYKSSDVLYCSGHAPLPDGRVLFMGGGRYWNLGDVEFPNPFQQQEFGLSYARIYDPHENRFARVTPDNPGGPDLAAQDATWNLATYGQDAQGKELRQPWYEPGMMWYPTNTRLPDGRVLINGGLARWVPMDGIADPQPNDPQHRKQKWDYHNRSLTIFDSKAFDRGRNPWSTLVSHEQAPLEVAIDVFDYPHVFLLPKPVMLAGHPRHVAIYGGAGWAPNNGQFQPAITLVSTDPKVPEKERFALPANSRRPNVGDQNQGKLHETTASMTADGRIVIMGGGNGGTTEGQRIDIYDPYTDSWYQDAAQKPGVDTGITRHKGASTLLPDGTILMVNGEIFYDAARNQGDRRQPTIFDPQSFRVTNLAPWSDDDEMRGYHNVSLLLKDGRVLIGGGRIYDRANPNDNNGSEGDYRIGCERPELRIFSPPYLFRGPRPELTNFAEPMTFKAGSKALELSYSGPELRAEGGVVLMALGAYTHSFDQNQRYIRLAYSRTRAGKLQVEMPRNQQIAPAGEYNLFLISKDGVPSVGKSVRVGG